MATAGERVPVLIVGGGYAGLASSLLLSHHGIRSVLVDRHPGLSIQGRARGINPRTMEIYRPLGIEPAVMDAGLPFKHDQGVARCETLAGEWQWLFEADAPRGWPELSAAEFVMADQPAVEPILMEAARARGGEHRFNTELVSFEAGAEGVLAVTEDRSTGLRRELAADYLVAADGNRSSIRERLGIARPGLIVTRHYVTVLFEADLSRLVRRRALFWFVINPTGSGALVTTAVQDRWGAGIMYDPESQAPSTFTSERCAELVRGMVGVPDLVVRVLDISFWQETVGVAERFRDGRVFLVGDSAHTWPPAGAMGANSAVHDAHNLAWKLAGVVNRWADGALLDSYEAERRPVALELAKITTRRQETRTGADPTEDDVDDTVLILGQRYNSTAVVGASHDTVFGDTADLRARPGTRMPHFWLEEGGGRMSSQDLCHDAFVLFTGQHGQPWRDAVGRLTRRRSLPLRALSIATAPGPAVLVDSATRLRTRCDAGPGDAILVRPDGYVAWRSPAVAEPEAALELALHQILGSRAAG